MKLIKKLTALLLLTFGIPFSIALLAETFNPNEELEDRQEALTALIVLTLPSTAVGGWLAWGLRRQNQKEIGDRLQSTFYQLIKQGNGHINILNFAMETQLTAAIAKQYLDEKAKEFNADFYARDDGSISYYFALGDFATNNILTSPSIPANVNQFNINITDTDIPSVPSINAYASVGKFDVLVTEYPESKKIAVLRVVRNLTGWGLKQAKDFVESLPNTLKKDVSESIAKSAQQQLESAGAKVTLVSARLDSSKLIYNQEKQFSIIVTECPPDKLIPVIKVVRELTGLGLKESKDFVCSLPRTLKKGISESVAKSHQQQLEAVGAKVILMSYE